MALETRPGQQFAYSSFGYVLLAHIIEQVSGQSYAAFLEQAIFTPLNMSNTGYEDSPASGIAVGYTNRNATTAAPYVPLPISDGAGQLYSTTEDIYLWGQALNTDQLLPQMILFGGEKKLNCQGEGAGFADTLEDTWAWDVQTQSWAEMHPTIHPAGHLAGQMVYDAESDRAILFGGTDATHFSSAADRMFLLGSFDASDSPRAWTYDLNANTWAEIGASLTVPDWSAYMVYDADSDRFIVFPMMLEKYTTVYDLNTGGEEKMTLRSGAAFLGSRYNNSMIYVEDLDRVFLFSGWLVREDRLATDIWLYGLNTNTCESGAALKGSAKLA